MLKEHKNNLLKKDISDVLIVCTGGTFCMEKTPVGYQTQKGLINRLKKYHCFNDEVKGKELKLGDN